VDKLVTGNFDKERHAHRDWIFGHFMDQDSPFRNENFEIKWGKHKKGESFEAKEVGPNDQCCTVAILVYGEERLTFSSVDREVLLENEGDYVFWQPNIPHIAVFREDTLVITIRWPSVLKSRD